MARNTTRGRRGRPSWEPTEAQRKDVLAMAGFGFPLGDIAKALGVSIPTLRKHCKSELGRGHVIADAKVANTLFSVATDPRHPRCVTAAIWWEKTRRGLNAPTASEESPGKKERAAQAAQTAGEDTIWGEDLKYDGNVIKLER